MEPGSSLPHSQQPATCPYPDPNQSSPYFPFPLLKLHITVILPSMLRLIYILFPSGLPTNTLYAPLLSPIRATCPVHLIFLELISRKIFREQYKSQSSSLCSFLHSPAPSSFLDLNMVRSTLLSKTSAYALPSILPGEN